MGGTSRRVLTRPIFGAGLRERGLGALRLRLSFFRKRRQPIRRLHSARPYQPFHSMPAMLLRLQPQTSIDACWVVLATVIMTIRDAGLALVVLETEQD